MPIAKPHSPEALYRRERRRAQPRLDREYDRIMAEAQAQYDAFVESQAPKTKKGRKRIRPMAVEPSRRGT